MMVSMNTSNIIRISKILSNSHNDGMFGEVPECVTKNNFH